MTDGPLKSTMCCRGQGRRGSGGVHSSSFGAFGLAGSDSGSRGRGAPLAFRLLRLFFPPPCPRVGGEKLQALSSTPPGLQRPAGARTGSSSTISSGYTCGSDGKSLGLASLPTLLFSVRQVSLKKKAAERNMSLMFCRWDQNNFTMKLVGCTLPGHHK
ncbi:hypothetical protein JOQ06_009648, partial [Pogonophryne albipinna]